MDGANTECNSRDCTEENSISDGDSWLRGWEETIYLDRQLAKCSSMDFVWELPRADGVLVRWMLLLTCCGLSVETRFEFQGLRLARHVTCLNVMVVEFCCTAQWLCEFDCMIRLSDSKRKNLFIPKQI
jgi:hypothetical protein